MNWKEEMICLSNNKKTFSIKLQLDGIGPHFGPNAIDFFDSSFVNNKAIIYAANGTGKSFISKTFRVLSQPNEIHDDLISQDCSEGKMTFGIDNQGESKKLSVTIKRGELPEITNDTNYLFHVFNSDYVDENLISKGFSPDGNIEGYILGKANIDLSQEKQRQEECQKEYDEYRKDIEDKILNSKRMLKKYGVQRNTTEFREFTGEKLESGSLYSDVSLSVTDVIDQLKMLENIPEDLEDVAKPSIVIPDEIWNTVHLLLETEYPKPEWDEEFSNNMTFISHGIEMMGDENKCPFCKQELKGDSLRLISHYKAFIEDKSSETIKKIQTASEDIKRIESAINGFINNTTKAALTVEKIKQYFPSLKTIVLEQPSSFEQIIGPLEMLRNNLEEKTNRLSDNLFDAELFSLCQSTIDKLKEIEKKNADLIQNVNSRKRTSSKERLELRKELCKAEFNSLKETLQNTMILKKESYERLDQINNEILEKERAVKRDRREEVYWTVTRYLSRFFGEKYTLDKDSFEIQFRGKNVGEKASRILSDGEKNLVAFSLFLASTHLVVQNDSDYDRLFFIIDDPISSLDFDHVYGLAQSLRSMKQEFGINSHVRMWIFTHDIEFLSVLARSGIINSVFVMTPGIIEKYNYENLLPYGMHLKDVVAVSKGSPPTHTTGNSIRHVLETICKFEQPKMKLLEYVSTDKVLSNNSAIYSLCEDLSHGNIVGRLTYTPEMLTDACKVVVEFMKNRYEGQIKVAMEG